jgi:hypothetical protein
MFEIMQQDVIRVSAYVPQDVAFGVAPGVDTIVRVPKIPDREFSGTVTRIADALQPGTRTLLMVWSRDAGARMAQAVGVLEVWHPECRYGGHRKRAAVACPAKALEKAHKGRKHV